MKGEYLNMEKKVILIGSVDTTYNLGGETLKNKLLISQLKKNGINVTLIDIEEYKSKNIFKIIRLMFLFFYTLFFSNTKKIIVSKHPNGAFLVFKILKLFNIRRKEVYYFVVGGMLTEKLKEGRYSLKYIKNIKKIFVQSHKMVEDLKELGIDTGEYIPNSKPMKNIEIVKKEPKLPIKIVFLSRMIKEKGVDLLLEATKKINQNSTGVITDFYGPFGDKKYKESFVLEIKDNENISYNGILDLNKEESYKRLSKYDLFVFPTYYEGEGFAGVLLDAMIAGLPILASDWRYNQEIVNDDIGYIFRSQNQEDLISKLKYICNNMNELKIKSKNSLKEAKKYDSNVVGKKLIDYIFSNQ